MPRYGPAALQLPPQLEDEDEEEGGIDPHDDADYRVGNEPNPPRQAGVSILEDFIKHLETLDEMTGPDISAVLDGLPIPVDGAVAGMSVREAVEVGCNGLHMYISLYEFIL